MKLIKETVEAGHGEVEFEVVEGCPAVELSQEHPCIQLAQKLRKNLVSCRNESYRRLQRRQLFMWLWSALRLISNRYEQCPYYFRNI